MHERRTTKVIDDDVKGGCVLKNMADESLRDHLVMQCKRLATCAMVRDEIMDVVQGRAVTGSSIMLVDALTKGKGKGKKRKGEGKDPKGKDDKGKRKGWKNKAKDNSAKSHDSKDSAQTKCFCCERIGHMKSDCQQCADDVRKATGARRLFVDNGKKVAALQTTEETPTSHGLSVFLLIDSGSAVTVARMTGVRTSLCGRRSSCASRLQGGTRP